MWQEAKKEKERLLAELAHDKAIRAKNKGVLPSVLGVEGYNPSIIQYDQPSGPGAPAAPIAAAKPAASAAASAKDEKKSSTGNAVSSGGSAASGKVIDTEAAERTVDTAISTIMRYRTAGDGGNALKLLHTFVKNVADSPDDRKWAWVFVLKMLL